MKKVKITVMKITEYKDLMEKYENKIEHTCDMKVGQVFYIEDMKKPEGFCDSAWETIEPFAIRSRSRRSCGLLPSWRP